MSAKLTQNDMDNFESLIDGTATHFSAQLVRLIKRADHKNRAKLAQVFPEHVEAEFLWEVAPRPTRLWICPFCGWPNASRLNGFYPGSCCKCVRASEPRS